MYVYMSLATTVHTKTEHTYEYIHMCVYLTFCSKGKEERKNAELFILYGKFAKYFRYLRRDQAESYSKPG